MKELVIAFAVVVFACLPLTAGTVVDLASERLPAILGGGPYEEFGYSSAWGDLNGDGVAELAVGAPGLAGPDGRFHEGGVYVFTRAMLETLSTAVRAPAAAAGLLRGGTDRGRFGLALAVGDLDGDGTDDLVVGAPSSGSGRELACGSVAVFFGGPGFLSEWDTARAETTALESVADTGGRSGTSPDVVLVGRSAGGRLGSALLIHDLDGDGQAELTTSEPHGGGSPGARPGAAYILRGSDLRELVRRAPGGVTDVDAAAAAIVLGASAGDGLSGLAAADTDGDGRVDLVLGAYQSDGPAPEQTDAGSVYFLPAADVMSSTTVSLAERPVRTLQGVTGRGFLGRSLAAGDIDGDGTDDVLVAAYGSRGRRKKVEASGEVFVIFGGSEGIPALGDGVPRFESRSRSDMLGLPVLLADINGDSYDDIMMAAQHADFRQEDRDSCGEVYVFKGSLRSVVAAKTGDMDLADVTVVGGKDGDSIGGSLLAADVSGDGTPELLIGAPDAAPFAEDGVRQPGSGMLLILPGDTFE